MTTSDEPCPPVGSLQRQTGVALWRQIAEELETDVRALYAGRSDRLPNEASLAARFNVNRHTVRRALADLAARGLVSATAGRGTFINRDKLAYPIGARTRFGEAVARAGREASGELLSHAIEPASAEVALHLGVAAGANVIRLTTRRSADGVVIATSSSWFPSPRFDALPQAFVRSRSITEALVESGVSEYRRRDTRIAGQNAGIDEAACLEVSEGVALLAVASVNVDATGTPIQYTRALFAADRVELFVGG